MKDHPLTPKKPIRLAALAGTAVTALVAGGSFVGGILLLPPVAWLAGGDQEILADPHFLGAVMVNIANKAVAHANFLAQVGGVVDMPFAAVDALKGFGLSVSMSARTLSSLIVGAFLGNVAFDAIYVAEIPTMRVHHISGAKLLSKRAARRMLKSAWWKKFGYSEPGVELAKGLKFPRQLEALHFLLLGGTGAGKTTILQWLMGSAFVHGDRMLVLDVKGDMTARFPTDAFVLLSIEDFRSDRWVPGLDFLTTADAEELAIELIAATSDPSWSNGGRRVLAAVIRFLQKEMSARGKAWTWVSLNRMLQMPIEDLHRILSSFDPQVASFIDVTQDETRKQAMSFYLVLIAGASQTIATMGDGGGQAFSVRRWFEGKDRRQAVIVRQSQRLPKLSAMMARLVLKAAADTAAEYAADAAPPPTWFFLDEIAQIGKTEAAARLATIGRSASVRLVACVQAPSQLREIYGPEGTQTLLDNLTTKIVGRVAAGATAHEICEKWIRTRKVEWWETDGLDDAGRPKAVKKKDEIPVVDAQFLSDELGAVRAFNGDLIVKALVLGQRDVALLDWPVGIWPIRRASVVTREDAKLMLKSGRRIS